MHACIHSYTHTHMHAHTNTHTHARAHTHTHTRTRARTHTHTHTHAHTHTHIHSLQGLPPSEQTVDSVLRQLGRQYFQASLLFTSSLVPYMCLLYACLTCMQERCPTSYEEAGPRGCLIKQGNLASDSDGYKFSKVRAQVDNL